VRVRAAASVALIAAVAALLAGCSLFMQPETQQPYNPADGINVTIGELGLRNVLVVTEDGELGNLVMVAVNGGDRDITATLQYETDGTKHEVEIEVPAKSSVNFGSGDSGQLLLENLGARAGGLLDLYVQYGDIPGKQLQVPVVDGGLPQYQDLTPVKPMPTHSPEPSETPTPSATPAG
jgi:hypothetical protein